MLVMDNRMGGGGGWGGGRKRGAGGGGRGAVRPPPFAASLIHLPPGLRTLCMPLASVSARAQRLRDGDRASRRVCRRCHRTVQLETLAVAHDPRDPLGGLAVPPLDDGSRRGVPRE